MLPEIRLARGNGGFTLTEVLIGSALLGILSVASMQYVSLFTKGNYHASSRLQLNALADRVAQLLSSPAECVRRLELPPVGNAAALPGPEKAAPITRIRDLNLQGLGTLENDSVWRGMKFKIRLRFAFKPGWNVGREEFSTAQLIGTGAGGSVFRYQAWVELLGDRSGPVQANEHFGSKTISAMVPLSILTDSSGRVIRCTSEANEIDEFLGGGSFTLSQRKTVRNCYQYGGFPIPTREGLVCRLQVDPKKHGNQYGVDPENPPSKLTDLCRDSHVAGPPWSSAEYYSTASRALPATRQCNGSTNSAQRTGFHYFQKKNGRVTGEVKVKVKKGSPWWGFGSKCSSEERKLYSQVIAVGCW